MRILVISNLLPPDFEGGQEISTLKAAQALRARGHDVEAVTSRFRPDYKGSKEEPDWVHRLLNYRVKPALHQTNPWLNRIETINRQFRYEMGFAANHRAVARWLAGRPPFDVAYISGLGGVGVGVAAAPTALGVPVLYHCGDRYLGEHFLEYRSSRLMRALYATGLREVARNDALADKRHVAFLSRFLADDVSRTGFPMEHVHIIPRGIEFPPRDDVDRLRDDPFTFLAACRITPDKGLHHLVEAAVRLRVRRPDLRWKVEVIGRENETEHPGYGDSLRRRAKEGGITDRISFLPQRPQDQVLDRFVAAGAFVSASVWDEPFGRTLIETMASGTPLIAARAGAIAEIVDDGIQALIYDKDDPEALSQQMETILTEPALARALAVAGLARVRERYTMDRIIDLTEQILERVKSQPST